MSSQWGVDKRRRRLSLAVLRLLVSFALYASHARRSCCMPRLHGDPLPERKASSRLGRHCANPHTLLMQLLKGDLVQGDELRGAGRSPRAAEEVDVDAEVFASKRRSLRRNGGLCGRRGLGVAVECEECEVRWRRSSFPLRGGGERGRTGRRVASLASVSGDMRALVRKGDWGCMLGRSRRVQSSRRYSCKCRYILTSSSSDPQFSSKAIEMLRLHRHILFAINHA